MTLGSDLGGIPVSRAALVAGAVACLSLAVPLLRTPWKPTVPAPFAASPKATIMAELADDDLAKLPYPPNVLPGGRDAHTPYGSIRVFEWGPEQGERVLLVHGISTPAIALGDVAHDLASRGHRVMLFDLFGRGYSDAPTDVAYDSRLYVTQMLLVLASSPLSWSHFHLVGYSLGGALCVAFARYFPQRLASLNLVATGGLIRPRHVSWKSKLLYRSGLLPESLVRYLVRRRLRPAAAHVQVNGDGDAHGGPGFDSASISRCRPGTTVASVVTWQLDHHDGFIAAFLSTIRNAPIYAPQEDWSFLASVLEARRKATGPAGPAGLAQGKVLLILASGDPVVVASETMEDAKAVLGEGGVECCLLVGGHELPITSSSQVVDAMARFWQQEADS